MSGLTFRKKMRHDLRFCYCQTHDRIDTFSRRKLAPEFRRESFCEGRVMATVWLSRVWFFGCFFGKKRESTVPSAEGKNGGCETRGGLRVRTRHPWHIANAPPMAVHRRAKRKFSARTQKMKKRYSAFSRVRLPLGHNGISQLTDEQLLDTRICDLGLRIENSPLQESINRLYEELEGRDLKFRPHCWLSDEWFSPDGIPGIAIPFYLAHPRLMRLERRQMMEVEGGTRGSMMKILRHEAGHAIDTAFRLHRKRSYREVFGNYFSPYPEYYRPRPNSKSYVSHLEPWYAQSHPSEDFAETFAVWLAPGKRWKQEYRGWRALHKLEFVDELMASIAGASPKVRSKLRIEPISGVTRTLREHYQTLHERYEIDCTPENFDAQLQKLFAGPESRRAELAADFLKKHRHDVGRVVSQWTGENLYNVHQVLNKMIQSAERLRLTVSGDEATLKNRLVAMVTAATMNTLHGSQHRVAL
jgi:hypothetical protein